MKDTLSFLAQALLQKNKIKIDGNELDFQIQSHPSYPSLHAITGVLNHFNIENGAIQIPVNEETLTQLPNSFIAQIKNNEGEHFALIIKNALQYKLIFDSIKKETLTQKEFLKQFTGVIVAVEKDENIQVISKNKNAPIKFLAGVALILFAFLFFISKPNIIASIHFVLSLVGFGISALIVQHDLGIKSKLIDSICSQDNSATNCDAVLNSKGATLFSFLKLGDISLIYFASINLLWLANSLSFATSSFIFSISILAIPAILYSLYYQIVITKTWCTLCLGIASVLFAQAVIVVFTTPTNFTFPFYNALLIALVFVSVVTIWLFNSSKMKKEQELITLKIESTKFKRNFVLFNTLLEKSETINTSIPDTSEIVFGNKNAALNITVITNPFCGHCKSVHTLIEDILKTHHEEISITVRFNVNTNNPNDEIVKITTRLLEIYQVEGEINCLQAMHDIYNNNNTKHWFAKWKTCTNSEAYITTLKNENEWCIANSINFTPEILVNGKSFPQAYNRSDLAFFIEELNDDCYLNANTSQLQETI
ncbi:vitamin K epoxide reductase family protein [Lacinutrix cladophorae]